MHKLIIQKKKKVKFNQNIQQICYLQKIKKRKQHQKCKNIEIDETDGYPLGKRVCFESFEFKENTKITSNFHDVYKNNNYNFNELDLWYVTEIYDNLANWKQLGKCLNLTHQELLIIETKYLIKDSLKECFYQMLLKWRLKEPENCDLDYLNQILIKKASELKLDENCLNFKEKFINYKSNDDNFVGYTKRLSFYLNKYFNNLTFNDACLKLKNLKLTEKNLWHASDYLFQEWKTIARYLLLSENDIYLIDNKHYLNDTPRECCYQMLLKWRELYPNDCYLYNLCTKLIKINLNLYVCQLFDYFSKYSFSSV